MSKTSNIIVFFIPPIKTINGGIISIFSLAAESRKFEKIHSSQVLVCTYPGTKSYGVNNLFGNKEIIYDFERVLKEYPTPKKMLLNIPEYAIFTVYSHLLNYQDYLNKIETLQINILNQNILLMPDRSEVISLFSLTPNVTQTIAHIKYCNQEIADYYNIPTHLFSVSIDKSNYECVDFDSKQDQIVYSPDNHPLKNKILKKINQKLPKYKLIEVKNLKYEKYKDLIAQSKYVITFGEGFDSYYIEPIFSCSLALTVYNKSFFPSAEFKKLKNVYSSYEDMLEKITKDLILFDNKEAYADIVRANSRKLQKIYSYNLYLDNIERFYLENYSFKPKKNIRKKLISDSVIKKDRLIISKTEKINDLKKELSRQININTECKQEIEGIKNSISWRITGPLRNQKSHLPKE